MKIVVVTVNYNSSHDLESLYVSLTQADWPCRWELIVVDNNSNPRQQDVLRQFEDDDKVEILWSPRNSGFGPAVNGAVAHASAEPEDLVWILNPDVEVRGDSVVRLAAALGDFNVVSPLLIDDRSEKSIWFCGGYHNRRSAKVVHNYIGLPYEAWKSSQGSHPVALETTFMSGAAPMMTLQTWRTVGGFDESLFLYWEDAEWSDRAVALGLTMAVIPESIAVHREGASSRTGASAGKSDTTYFYCARNRLLIQGSWARRLKVLVLTGGLEGLRVATLILLREDRRWVKFRAHVMGSWAGLLGRCGARHEC